MASYLLRNVSLVNEGTITTTDVLIKNDRFERIGTGLPAPGYHVNEINAEGLHLLPGLIDIHVHFRQPGLTNKATIASDSRAAVAGGVTSFLEMPNTNPPATTKGTLQRKYRLASSRSVANYGFYIGAAYSNFKELESITPQDAAGVKIFIGSSTGNMLLNDPGILEYLFSRISLPVAVHAEDEQVISNNLKLVGDKYNKPWPHYVHTEIRSAEGCYRASEMAVELAEKYGTRLHVLHLTTGKEVSLFASDLKPGKDKFVTTEVCPHHLYFDDRDYEKYGGLIKCNPAIKSTSDKKALLKGLINGNIDMVSSDHAPHLLSEKRNDYENCPAGIPMVQHSLSVMLDFYRQGSIPLTMIPEKMAHNQAEIYRIKDRGYVREGYFADAVLLNLDENTRVNKESILYKCGWSPFEGTSFPGRIEKVWVNGTIACEDGIPTGIQNARPLITG